MQRLLLKFSIGAFAVFVIAGLGACRTSKTAQKDLLYLQGTLDTVPNMTVSPKEITIQKGDLLSIIVYSDNPEATVIYNQQQIAPASGTGGSALSGVSSAGYLVDERGNIQFQTLGSIHAEGLTKLQLTDKLTESLKTYLKNPYVNIRFLNFRFTVIGEVNKPGTFTVPQEKVSILEVIGLAGDLTIYGRRDNILIIREVGVKRQFGRIDLRKNDIFQSPYFYLQQNDMVIIEQNKKKQAVNDQTTFRNISIISSIISTLAIVVSALK